MKVKDLIVALSSYDGGMDVVMDAGSEGIETVNDIDVPAKTTIIRNQHTEYWFGKHDYIKPWQTNSDGEEVVVIIPKK